MNEWFKKTLQKIKELWGKWTLVQKIILFAIIAVFIGSIILLFVVSSAPSSVPLITTPITNEQQRIKISARLDQEGVNHTITADGRILVKDLTTAQRMRAILFREDLIPREASPWDVFQLDRWTVTDFERNVNLRQAVTKDLELHIQALDDVDKAQITLVMPETQLFAEDQKPVTASVIITPRPGSDITSNRKKIEGIVRLVKFAVEGLTDDNLVITDHNGIVLNNFADLADFDRLEVSKREMKTKNELENRYKNEILKELMQIFGSDRVRILRVEIDMNYGKKVVETKEHFPVTMVQDNPKTPFDETVVVPSIRLSTEKIFEEYKGSAFNPEGPPGQEGQTPPAYKDLEGMVGYYKKESAIENEQVNQRNIFEEKASWEMQRVTVGVALDGLWRWKYDEKGNVLFNPDGSIMREYIPVSDEDLAKAKTLVEHAIGYNRDRGDSVTVQHLSFDRTAQFQQEDSKFRARARLQQTILFSLIGAGVLVVAFVAFRLISREIERKRRLREEELARQHQAMREAALRSAEEEGLEVQMSVEDRARMEMQENAINMAREHPEDVAQLIRTWLMEE